MSRSKYIILQTILLCSALLAYMIISTSSINQEEIPIGIETPSQSSPSNPSQPSTTSSQPSTIETPSKPKPKGWLKYIHDEETREILAFTASVGSTIGPILPLFVSAYFWYKQRRRRKIIKEKVRLVHESSKEN